MRLLRAWALGCFHSLISTQTFRRARTAPVDSCAEIKSGVTKSGRVWREVPESDAQSVALTQDSVKNTTEASAQNLFSTHY